MDWFIISMIIVVLAFIILWAETLYELGGRDLKIWFYLVLLIPPLWILYRLVNFR